MPNSPTRQPPRFVPTLTDVVSDKSVDAPVIKGPDAINSFEESAVSEGLQAVEASEALACPPAPDWTQMAQAMQAKVMQRLDTSLEERLRYALADMVQQHTQSLYLALREDVARLVSTAVHEAIAEELVQMRKAPVAED